ncbi:hypothetical protein B1R94_02105 [Mycolicibacterium litorale]|nr:hypothetical protein B1R94_02105 [Mycolicibacterium litorale]
MSGTDHADTATRNPQQELHRHRRSCARTDASDADPVNNDAEPAAPNPSPAQRTDQHPRQ